jgi:protein gp37
VTDGTKIEWTDATWNPVRGCTRVSEGCRNCYAEGVAARFSGRGLPYEGLAERTSKGPRWTGKITLAPEATLLQPLRWKRPRRIFVNSMSDLFHEGVPDEAIDRIFAVMALARHHTFQVLTKRPERMRSYLSTGFFKRAAAVEALPEAAGFHGWPRVRAMALFNEMQPPPNVWLGTSVEDQAAADTRIPHLLATPAAVRFLSCEPLLGPVELTNIDCHQRRDLPGFYWINALTGEHDDMCRPCAPVPRIDWVIVGGESGPNARQMHPNWARTLRYQCAAAGVAYFFKQWGEWGRVGDQPGLDHLPEDADTMTRVGKAKAGRLLDGVEHNGMPRP